MFLSQVLIFENSCDKIVGQLSPQRGGHGIMVITGGCGPLNTGSIPVGHPCWDLAIVKAF